MGATRHQKEARALVKEHGTYIRKTHHGELWKIGDNMVTIPEGTPSDGRAWRNALSDVKRVMREAFPAEPQPKEDTVTAADNLSALDKKAWFHVQRETIVVKHHREECTIDLAGFAESLGLTVNSDSKITLKDTDGVELKCGPLLLCVESEVMEVEGPLK